MKNSGTCRNSTPAAAPSLSERSARRPSRAEPLASERMEGSKPPGHQQINRHDHDGHYSECRGERDVARSALKLIHRLADERARVADDARDDVVAECQRKSKYRTRDHAWKRQRQDDLAESLFRR